MSSALNHPRRNRALFLSVVLALLALTLPAPAAEVTVFAAASLTDVLKTIAAGYERGSTDKIVFNFGASSLLARQIQEGAPADIFFSADEAKMNALAKQGLVLEGTRKSLLSNTLVIVVAADSTLPITGPQDLAAPPIKHLALADPQAVPAGIYAKEFLQKRRLWAAIKDKVVPTQNVRAALAEVESGNVEAGIVYQTDAAISKQVKVAYRVPVKEGPPISYPVAIIKGSSHIPAARPFLAYLESRAAARVFLAYGFVVLK
jgi:molybdate transport system substrate-binding protein